MSDPQPLERRRILHQHEEEGVDLLGRFLDQVRGEDWPLDLQPSGMGTYRETPAAGVDVPTAEVVTLYAVARTQRVISDLLLTGGSSLVGERPIEKR